MKSKLIFLAGFIFLVSNCDKGNIDQEIAKETIAEYEIAKKQGDKMQICIQAGMVATAFLQAKDEANYGKWKDIEKKDCAEAEVPDLE